MQNEQTLMLDQGYAPVGIIPWQRAMQMLFLNKCEVVEEYDHEIKTTYLVIKVPAVVRLLGKVRRKKKLVKFSRVNIYGRDGYQCQFCGIRLPIGELTYDHVIPRSQGGKTEWTNIVSCCSDCNQQKANRTPEQAKMKLLKVPIQPVDLPAIVIPLSRTNVPDAWREYLYWTGSLDA
jgi:5-methylcytosine-specific restriction endonuclease McrA